MSHDHRDEHELTTPVVDAPEPVVVAPLVAVVSNSEAERRAAERRKLEGAPEQTTQHQFTGDAPEPERGGTDTETRIRFRDSRTGDDEALAPPAAAARRGPPPPRTLHVADEVSWAPPPTLDAVGTGALRIDSTTWVAPDDHGHELRLASRHGEWVNPRYRPLTRASTRRPVDG